MLIRFPSHSNCQPEDHWSCIAHLSAEDMLKSAVTEENKTCRRTGKLACNCAFPLWSILESFIYSYQTWFKSIKGFAETDTVKI